MPTPQTYTSPSAKVQDLDVIINGSQTTAIAAGSNGANVSSFVGAQALSVTAGTTSAFFPIGTLLVATGSGNKIVTYTGKTTNSFTNCTCTSTGLMSTGGAVQSCDTLGVTYTSNGAQNGDTVNIPADNQVWPVGLTINDAITLSGAGTGVGGTIIKNGQAAGSWLTINMAPSSPTAVMRMKNIEFQTPTTSSVPPSDGSNVNAFAGGTGVLTVADTAGFPSSGALSVTITTGLQVSVTYTAKTSTTFTGCKSNASGVIATGGAILFAGPSPGVQIVGTDQRTDSRLAWHDCVWNNVGTQIYIDTVCGVVCDMTMVDSIGGLFHVYAKQWKDGVSDTNDGSWNAPINWGTEQWLFFERLNITNIANGICDSYYGGRSVWRFNDLNRPILSHGTETGAGSAGRGNVALDIYKNTFRNRNNTFSQIRSGVLMCHDNIGVNWPQSQLTLRTYRATVGATKLWWGADGSNKLDLNSFANGGTNTAPTPFYGPHVVSSVGSNPPYTVTISPSPGWIPNQWVGYLVENFTTHTEHPVGNVPGDSEFSNILSNTADTLTFQSPGENTTLTFLPGTDQLVIRKVNQYLDGIGIHGGSLSGAGSNPAFPNTDPTHYPGGKNDQKIYPCYEWRNTSDTAPTDVQFPSGSCASAEAEGVYYFNNTTAPTNPTDGSEGYPVSAFPGGGYNYPHPLSPTAVPVTPPVINSALTASSTQGSAFSYTITATNSPTSFGATSLPANFAINTTTGVISCTGAANVGATGLYKIIITATNLGGSDTQELDLTLSAPVSTSGGGGRGRGKTARSGTGASRF